MISHNRKCIEFPPEFVKQGRTHTVAIAPPLSRLLDRCPIEGGTSLVFPSPRTGRALSGWSKSFGYIKTRSGVAFKPHDLRRTFRSGLTRLGVDVDTAERALGHARAELIEVYDRERAEDRTRAAFEIWGAHVAAILAADEAKRAAEAISEGDGVFG